MKAAMPEIINEKTLHYPYNLILSQKYGKFVTEPKNL